MTPAKWDIWLVDMPYEEGVGSKTRPALVLGFQGERIIVGKLTKHPPRDNYPYEYLILDWKGAGLALQTTLRLFRLPSLEPSAFLRKLGVIQPVDQVNVRRLLDERIAKRSKR